MKKLFASALLASLVVSGCTQKSSDLRPELKQDPQSQDISKMPNWVMNPQVDNGVAATGIASPSAGEIKFQVNQAERDARAKISAAFASEVATATKIVLKKYKLEDANDVEVAFDAANEEIVANLPVNSAQKIATYQGEDGSLYVRMVLKDEDINQYLANSQKIYAQKLKKADISEDDAEEGEDAAEELLAKLKR